MDADLKFRYRQHDGRNVAIVAAAGIVVAPVLAAIGWPAAALIAGLTLGYLGRDLLK
jgi:hypothetical protein